MPSQSPSTGFDSAFWTNTLRQLGYPLRSIALDVASLKSQKAVPSDVAPLKVTRLYVDDYVEIALIELDGLTRGVCTKTARSWNQNRLIKPLLLFTDGVDSFAVIVPGKGLGGPVKVLGLSDRLYRTDREVLDSMRYPGDPELLNRRYDTEFFPYQRVRDEFFEGYRDLYQKVEAAVHKELKDRSTSYAQRFLGRLMFLYFLQRKGWLRKERRFVDTLKDYYELNQLFYESLNTGKTPEIPFLNGSLFEREEYMDATMEQQLFPKMNPLFKEARSFFDDYNFTVDETSALEVEVSIDPALIGTVFENMLPEHERGSKGTFYTPAAESSFICRRAIANFLGFKDEVSPDGKKFCDGLALHIGKLSESKSEKDIREFRDRLLSLKILDPAVGSGGFLLTTMQEIVGLIQEAEAIVGWKSDAEEYKKKILPNLYGFDIEPEAVEIARLRLWLSLIIDQKEPEPLPNLDMNLIAIKDSLLLPDSQTTLDPHIEDLRETFSQTKARYLNEHDGKVKRRLKDQLKETGDELAKLTGTLSYVIEAFMPNPADIVVMNPPYVRQESIPAMSKEYYTKRYRLDKKSDLFAYFLVRALYPLSDHGVVSVISSDKWLETGYGVPLQERLKDNLIAIYGQRERTFDADINTVITVYTASKQNQPVHFTNLEEYGKDDVRQDIVFEKRWLRPGKWFYLRAPRIFLEKIRPKLTNNLRDFAEVKFGIKTGANEFFFMKDVSHLYEADYLADPRKFDAWGVKARSTTDIEKQGLIYIENEGGQRFVIDRKDVVPVIRSPTEVDSYTIERTHSLLFRPKPPGKPGTFSRQYINWGQNQTIEIKKGVDKGKRVRGYNSLSSTKAHRPFWFNVSNLDPAPIISFKFIGERHLTPFSPAGVLADHTCDLVYPTKGLERSLWVYMNSSLFFLTKELYGWRMGGGALQILTEEFLAVPVADVASLKLDFGSIGALKRKPLSLFEELDQADRKEFDFAILKLLGFEDAEALANDLKNALLEVLEDRLIKASSDEERKAQERQVGVIAN